MTPLDYPKDPKMSAEPDEAPTPDLVAIARRAHRHRDPAPGYQIFQNIVFDSVNKMSDQEISALHPESWLARAIVQLETRGPCPCGQLDLGEVSG
jgi:hypothetical protein